MTTFGTVHTCAFATRSGPSRRATSRGSFGAPRQQPRSNARAHIPTRANGRRDGRIISTPPPERAPGRAIGAAAQIAAAVSLRTTLEARATIGARSVGVDAHPSLTATPQTSTTGTPFCSALTGMR